MEERQYLIIMGVPGIKKYVFATDRLMEIRGASSLLAYLNEVETEKLLIDQFGESNVYKVFAAGGAGHFIVYAATERDIGECIKKLEGSYHQRTKGGLRLVCGIAEMSEPSYLKALIRAEADAQQRRDTIPFVPASTLHTGYVRECDACSEGIASHFDEQQGEKRLLCDICYEKVNQSLDAKKGFWKNFISYAKAKGDNRSFLRPKTFEEIGEQCASRRGYTALVYADGNSMGKLINKIETSQQFRFFAETVDRSIKEACYDAIIEKCEVNNKIMPAEILMIGGDDLLVYMTAESALPFAVTVAQKFTDKTKEKFASYEEGSFFRNLLQEKGLTISLGIAYGKSHTPFHIMLDQAEELLKSAKKAGSQNSNNDYDFSTPTYIDYHLSTQFNQIRVEECRKNHLESPGVKIYMRPYSLNKAESLLKHAEILAEELPNTLLNKLGSLPLKGKMNSIIEFLYLITRCNKTYRVKIDKALHDFGYNRAPWKKENDQYDTTVLVDLVEIASFCKSSGKQKEGVHDS